MDPGRVATPRYQEDDEMTMQPNELTIDLNTVPGIVPADDNIISMEQFGEGFQFNFPRVWAELRWKQWYEGQFASMYPQPTIANGFKLIDQKDLVTIPLFQMASDFYTEAVIAEGPEFSTDNDVLRTWLDDNRATILEVLERMVREWSITGYGILVTQEDGSLHEVESSAYFRVGELQDHDERVGHIIARTYYEPSELELQNPLQHQVPNRVSVTKYQVDGDEELYNEVQIFHFDGLTIQDKIGPQEDANITSISTVGRRDSWYSQSQRVCSQLIVTLSLLLKAEYKHINRPLILPNLLTGDTAGAGKRKTPQEVMNEYNELRDPVIQSTGPEGARNLGLVPGDYEFSEIYQSMLQLSQTYYLISGLPPTAYGIDIGRGESGFAREKSEDRAAIRARNVRDDIARVLPIVIRGMGAPDGELSASWRSSPFESRDSREARVIKYLQAGLITVQQAQQMLGLEVTEVSNAPTEQEGSQMRSTPQE